MALVFLVFGIRCLSSEGLRNGFSVPYGKKSKHKHQIPNKFKIQNSKLFVICDLLFVFSGLSGLVPIY
jgi:hypothetical protein